MGHWGVKSYENDGAHDALDAGFERACGDRYDELMEDDNPLTFEQIQAQLASEATLHEALAALLEEFGGVPDAWEDPEARLAYAGVVVRHAELRVPISAEVATRAMRFLREEEIDWDESTKRQLRLERELTLLDRQSTA
jgi:hypothetical protein